VFPPLSPSTQPKQGAPRSGFLIETKLAIPRLADVLVHRSRVLEALNGASKVPLTVVTAPAGYGKTTAVAQWAMHVDLPVSWISLGPEDNNPIRFLTYLLNSIKETVPQSLQEALADLSLLQHIQETMDLAASAMGMSTRHFFLIFDDFHVLTNEQLLRAVAFLINHLPLQAHVVLISRTTPALQLGRLRANGRLREIDTTDLAFSAEESMIFRSASGLEEVQETQWAAIADKAEGWIAGLQLARLSLNGQDRAGIARLVESFDSRLDVIDDYLLEEVLASVPADIEYFVLRSSLLTQLHPELCNYVFETDRGALLLRELQKRSLFVVALDPGRTWLRYHQLFAEALQRRLAVEVTSSEIATIHARAAEWLGDHGHEEQAIRHAIACQRWDLATALVRRISAPLAMSDRVTSMRYWLDLLPRDVVLDDPDLRYLLLWSLAISAEFAASGEDLSLIDKHESDPAAQARAHLVRMQTSYALGDVDRMAEHARHAIDMIPKTMIPALISARVYRASSQYLVGNFDEAESGFDEVRRLATLQPEAWLKNRGEMRFVDLLCLRGQLDEAEMLLGQLEANTTIALHPADTQLGWFMASIQLERNNLDGAENWLDRSLEVARITASDYWVPAAHITRAMVAWTRGDFDAAHVHADRARKIAITIGNPNFAQRADALQAMFWIARGQHILAERWLATANTALTWVREFNQPYPALAIVRLLAARDDLTAACHHLTTIIAATQARQRTGDLVRLHAIHAALLVRTGEPDHAAAELATALTLGAPGLFLRSFLDEGTALAGLFHHPLIREHPHRHYAQTVKQAFETQTVSLTPASRTAVEALSLRELEVLRLVASGQSNRHISQVLYISEPTVKKHISNILGKLDVLNRTQAVSTARDLGLLA